MGVCGSSTMNSVPPDVTESSKKEDPSVLELKARMRANRSFRGSAGALPRPSVRPAMPVCFPLTRAPPIAAIEGLKPLKENVVLVTGASSLVRNTPPPPESEDD